MNNNNIILTDGKSSGIGISGLEKEAEILFGNMRGATIAEQDGIQTCIDGISMPTGHNFWD